MISVLLTILKILGIILLVLLGMILVLLFLVLFVPIRYRLDAHRDLKEAEEKPIAASVRVSWLLHLLHIGFDYPDAAYVKVKVFGITVYRSDRERGTEQKDSPKEKTKDSAGKTPENKKNAEDTGRTLENKKNAEDTGKTPEKEKNAEDTAQTFENTEPDPKLFTFFKKLWEKIKNIKYTIRQIYDKINHIVKNIRYYLRILQSDTFKNAFSLCTGQISSLLKSIRPRKIKGWLLIGTGDPASTGQVLAVYGMMYPILGDHFAVTPDFEQQVAEGELLVKGKITLFKALKVSLVVFFNKDIRRLIKLFKREAA